MERQVEQGKQSRISDWILSDNHSIIEENPEYGKMQWEKKEKKNDRERAEEKKEFISKE